MATGGFSKSFVDVDAQEMSRGESIVCEGASRIKKERKKGGGREGGVDEIRKFVVGRVAM